MKEDQENNVIVVAWDFTHVAEYALAHAVKIANIRKYEVRMLHVVKPGAPSEMIENARRKMMQVCAETTAKHEGLVCKVVIKEGNLYTTISDYATQSNTNLVVMGTHGRKGIQKIFGSKALKVLIGSNTPFIVVKSKPSEGADIPKVVFPVHFNKENKEMLQWAIYIGQNFNSKIYLFKYPISASNLLKKVNTNLNFAIRFLKQYNIEYEIHEAPKKKKFILEAVQFAEQIDADLIIVTTTKYISIFDYMFGATEQKIIDNSAKIPVMCINPREGKLTGSVYTG